MPRRIGSIDGQIPVSKRLEAARGGSIVECPTSCERGDVFAVGHRPDVGPDPALGERLSQLVAVIGAIGEQHVAVTQRIEHVGGAAPVMPLSLGQFERNRQAIGIDQRLDLGRQLAARAPHASGSSTVPKGGVRRSPFLPFATAPLAAC